MKHTYRKNVYVKQIRLVLVLLCCIVLAVNAGFLAKTNIIKNQETFHCPSYMLIGENKNRYIINNSTTQILVLDQDNRYLFQIDGGSTRQKAFNFANNIAVDSEGNIYVTDVSFNDNYDRDKKVKLLKYNAKGKLDSILYEYEYTKEEELTIHSAFMSVSFYNSRFYFAQREKDSIAVYSIAVDGSEQMPTEERRIEYANAQLLVASIAIVPEKDLLYFVDKKGDIYFADNHTDEILLVYDGGNYHPDYQFYDVPNDIAVTEDGNYLYYTDIGLRQIWGISLETGERFLIYQPEEGTLDEQPIFYRLSLVEGNSQQVSFCDSNGNDIYIYNSEGIKIFQENHFVYSREVFIKYIALLLLGLFVIKNIIDKLKEIVLKTMAGSNAERFKTNLLVLVAVITVFITTASYVISNLNARYTENVLQSLYSMSRLTADMINGDLLETILEPDDYLNEDYMAIRSQIQSAFEKSYINSYEFTSESDSTLYCVLYRMQNHVVYYTMHLSDDSGVVYPDTMTFEESDYKYIEDTGETIIFSEISTGEGEWMYASAPVYNSKGEMIAVCEVGRNRTSYNQANQNMLIELAIKVTSLAVIVFLFMSEVIALISVFEKKGKEQKREENSVEFVRTFAFIMYMADNFTCVLIPLMSEALYDPSLPIAENIAIALPSGAQSFAAAITGFVIAGVMKKIGNRKSFLCGIIFHMVGLLLCGLSGNLYFFTISMFIVGIGMGINVVCLSTYVISRESEEDSLKGFSLITTGTFAGTNCGIIIGTLITEQYGYSTIFFISALMAGLLLLFVWMIYKKDTVIAEKEKETKKINLWAFLRNRLTWGYFLFAMLPYYIFASFVYYFMPLYAEQEGVSEANIGVITLVYGVMTAYLTSLTMEKITKRVGSRFAIMIASLVTIASLVLFIFKPSVSTIILVVLVMGIADSFGYSALSSYFSEIPAVKQYGEENALGISGVVEGVSSTIAPFIFATALLAGIQMGMILISIGFGICVVMFFLTSFREKREKNDG